MIEKQKLHDALRHMGAKNVRKPYRDSWSPENPTSGYCYVVAEVVYHCLAPKDSKSYCMETEPDETHWYIVTPEGEIIDLTSDQFDYQLDYSKGHKQNFRTKSISARGKKLADLLGLEARQ